ncbi:hypothetical protein FSO04_44325 [Paraburkholderia madseniana]|uniref:Uncharacterized protein n=1 Tax=Paraburkholderia madseniana TaxID=2599607 RepID=A0A6N6W1B5_9BURK|nr:hypothetical protein [Paraburkholderia madseniana]KAE8753584.1 hypothetical protein FSO04_44325 [Paraburkholderia madseniana]
MSTHFIAIVVENPPAWANETIRNWEEIFDRRGVADVLDFVTQEISEPLSQIDMRQVIGQDGHYAGQTWLEAVTDPQYKPSKMDSAFRKYDDNPSYYFSGEVRNDMYFSSLNGGPWYCDSGGNHRTIVAKFVCERLFRERGTYPLVCGVLKHSYFADLEALDLFKKLHEFRDRGIHVTVQRRQLSDYLVSEKHIFEYEPTFFVADFRFDRDNLRSQWLSAQQFHHFARHVLKHDGRVTRFERLKHYWLQFACGDFSSLILPPQ